MVAGHAPEANGIVAWAGDASSTSYSRTRNALMLGKQLLVLTFISALGVSVIAQQTPSLFKISSRRDDDRVEAMTSQAKTVFSIYSPVGISHAVIERTSPSWPSEIVLRLHLKGLENFEIAAGELKLEGSVALQNERPVLRLWKDSNEQTPLNSMSPHWIKLQTLDVHGAPAKQLPLRDGYFEMQLPSVLFEGNPKRFSIRWIDFYRS